MNIDYIQNKINNHREKLLEHKLYSKIEAIEDLRVFTQNHIYAVWDFMSLLKALQIQLTCTKTPWVPNNNSQTAYLINEIVLAEETDVNQAGQRKSHYELYLDAMKDIGAEIEGPTKIINEIAKSDNIFNCIDSLNIHPNIKEFLNFDCKSIIRSNLSSFFFLKFFFTNKKCHHLKPKYFKFNLRVSILILYSFNFPSK